MNNSMQQTGISRQEATVAADLFKALAHPLRLQIVSLLSGGDMHVKELAERLASPQAIISQQLRILRSADLVAPRTEGGRAYYRIIEPHLHDMLRCLGSCLIARRGKAGRSTGTALEVVAAMPRAGPVGPPGPTRTSRPRAAGSCRSAVPRPRHKARCQDRDGSRS